MTDGSVQNNKWIKLPMNVHWDDQEWPAEETTKANSFLYRTIAYSYFLYYQKTTADTTLSANVSEFKKLCLTTPSSI